MVKYHLVIISNISIWLYARLAVAKNTMEPRRTRSSTPLPRRQAAYHQICMNIFQKIHIYFSKYRSKYFRAEMESVQFTCSVGRENDLGKVE